mmetsp:Transcript_1379/g.2985  ORF Transcript_1379/g.2985 Transcript_1379/m.2985 type:complete len:210 (-) Transcript_1379:95-724(-)
MQCDALGALLQRQRLLVIFQTLKHVSQRRLDALGHLNRVLHFPQQPDGECWEVERGEDLLSGVVACAVARRVQTNGRRKHNQRTVNLRVAADVHLERRVPLPGAPDLVYHARITPGTLGGDPPSLNPIDACVFSPIEVLLQVPMPHFGRPRGLHPQHVWPPRPPTRRGKRRVPAPTGCGCKDEGRQQRHNGKDDGCRELRKPLHWQGGR